MDFTIQQADFARALRLVGRAAATKATLPILQSVLVEAGHGRLTMTAADLDIGVTTTVAAEVAAPGRAAIPARLLVEYVAQLPAEPVRLALDPASKRARAACGSFTANIATVDPDGFPTFAAADPSKGLDLNAGSLREALERVAFAAARDDSRPILSAVLFDFDGEGLTIAAADGFRLARARLPHSGAPSQQLLIPARAAGEFSRLLAGADSARLALAADGRLLHLAVKETTLFTRLVEGRYPDIERVIPQRWTSRVTVETAAFRQAVRVSGLFGGSGDARPVLIEAAQGQLTLQARGDEIGEAKSELPAITEGESQVVALNTRLLSDLLDAASSTHLELAWSGPQTPVVVRESGRAEPADQWISVLMPLHDLALTRGQAAAAKAA